MSTVLVTGGAGYIGSHAVKALHQRGEKVVVFDNLSAGHRAATRHADVVCEGDINDTAQVTRALQEHQVSAVMHYAADAMVAARVPHLIFSSTCAVFGSPAPPITEDLPKAPINAYGETKLAVERALPHYERAYGIRTTTLRYFDAAGRTRTASWARIMRRSIT